MHIQRFPVVPGAFADLAGHIHIRQKMHLYLDNAITPAGFATAALDIEAEPTGFVAAQLRLRRLAEQFAHRIEQAGVGRRIGARRATDRRLVDIDDLVDILRAANLPVRSRSGPSAVNLLRQRFIKNFIDQRALAGTGNPGHRRKHAQRKPHIDAGQIVFRRPQDLHPFSIGRAPLFRHRNRQFARQVLTGNRLSTGLDIIDRSLRHHMSAMHPGPRSDIDDVIGAEHGFFVMLDHQQGIAQITQSLQRIQQFPVIALMQADTRFIQNIQYTDQPRTNLRRQADPLRLAAGQRTGRPVQRQVIQSDIDQEAEPGVDFLADLHGNRLFPLRQLQLLKKRLAFAHRQMGDFLDVLAADFHCQRLFFQPGAVADRTGFRGHIAFDIFPHRVRGRLAMPPGQHRQYSFIGGEVRLDFAEQVFILKRKPLSL